MRVKVIDHWERVFADLRAEGRGKLSLFVTRGQEYTVYGLSLHESSVLYKAGVLNCQIVSDYGDLIFALIDIFSVFDPRMPDCWSIELRDGNVFIWPDIFRREFFVDDLSEGVPECVAAFRDLQSKLEGPD